MNRTTWTAVALAAVVALGSAGSAVAQNVPGASSPTPATPPGSAAQPPAAQPQAAQPAPQSQAQPMQAPQDKASKKAAAVLGAKVTLAQAVATAEQKTGGHAMKAEVEMKDGTYLYEIEAVSSDRAVEVSVDPSTGDVVRSEQQGMIERVFDNLFDRGPEAGLTRLTASSTTLGGAIAAAEQQTGGKAVEAAFNVESGTPHFDVRVAKDNTMSTVTVDPNTGKVTGTRAKNDEGDED